jgi:predicted CXXCH cytochrome family protein
MRRFTRSLLAVVGLLAATTAGAYTGPYTPGSGINGTVHDLGTAHNGMNYTAVPTDPVGGRICIFCHTPHNAYKLSQANGGPGPGVGGGEEAGDEFDYLPLWNHTLPNPVAAYTPYDNGPGAPQAGPKASQAIGLQPGMQIGSVSLLCLSCHDGSIAVNSYGNPNSSTPWHPASSISNGTSKIAPAYGIGLNQYLGNHHPIGFNYDNVQAVDTEIHNADTVMLTPTTFVRDHLYGTNGGNVECATCHSVHNKGNDGESLLWRSDQNSQLCLTCHDKGTYTAP